MRRRTKSSALKDHGVKDEEIQTSNFTIDSPWDPRSEAKSTGQFLVTNNVTITRNESKSVSELIQTAIDAGANSASNLTFFNSNPTAARDRTIELAVRDARAQAEKIAASVGRTVGAALLITTVPIYTPNIQAVQEAITVTAASPAIEAGTTAIGYSVTITYELK